MMLYSLSADLGLAATMGLAIVGTLAVLAWMPAVAAVVSGQRSWRLKGPMLVLLIALPPLSLVVLGTRVVQERWEERQLARSEALARIEAPVPAAAVEAPPMRRAA